MSLQVYFIRNVSTNLVLTWENNIVSSHEHTNNENNFEVKHQGGTEDAPQYYIQVYSDATKHLQATQTTTCQQSPIPTGSSQTIWYAEHEPNGNSLSGIKLYTMTGDGTKWYIRADSFSDSVDLVCSDYLTNPNYIENELKFNLVSVNVNNIMNS